MLELKWQKQKGGKGDPQWPKGGQLSVGAVGLEPTRGQLQAKKKKNMNPIGLKFIYLFFLRNLQDGFGSGACRSTLSLWAWLKDMIWCGQVCQKESRMLGLWSNVAHTGELAGCGPV